MEVKKIKLEGGLPAELTVKMSIQEAILIASLSGKIRGVGPHNEIYDSLTGEVMNRFWDDGVDDAIRGLYHHRIPEIKDEREDTE